MKNIRSNITRSVLHNKWNDTQIEFNGTEVHHDLNDDNGILTHEVRHIVALDCGHYAEPAGLCSVCERTVCASCMLTCASCGKPVGKCHAAQDKKTGAWHCSECRAAQKRRFALRLLLSPILRFKDENDVQ